MLSVYEGLITELIRCRFLTIPLHVERVLPVDAQMAVEQWGEEPQIRIVHGYTISAEPAKTSLEMDGIPDPQ